MTKLPERRRGLKLKEGASLPDVPRFTKRAETKEPEPAKGTEPSQPNTVSTAGSNNQPKPSHQSPKENMANDVPPVRVTVRVGFAEDTQQLANQCLEKHGGHTSQLAKVIARTVTIADSDFSDAGVPGARDQLAITTHQIICKVDHNLYTKWAKKYDPFGSMKPGDIVRGAANVAFNRAARTVLKELIG